jgi:hypothetical protein
VGEEDSTAAAAADFMEAAEQRFMGEGVSAPEAALRMWADAPMADIVAATMDGGATTGATTEAAAVTAGATDGVAGIGAEDTVTDGAGELALGGRIGVGAGDIRMATTTARDITRLDLIILTRTPVLRTILRAMRILATGTAILHRQIPTHSRSQTRTGPQDPGDHPYRGAHLTLATQTLPPRPLRRMGRFSPLTG